ncbi:MAG: GTPase domain-containing protein [Planctomycetes bacterium]|nr:GTPase domain-containing protein [Planctomycetota bacterium]MCB9904074.1 GTPase domain-containing protein [Planctomycetota bacterium]
MTDTPGTDPRTLTLSLVSHTNVGKTTLARTLLRREVGEVLDQAHVTVENQRHELLSAPTGERLVLWDTPGFGDSARLSRRLRDEPDPVRALLEGSFDPQSEAGLYCSQQAARNIAEEADVVLYLVNASEWPEEAGYVTGEMEVLGWIGRPVLVLLNQVSAAQDAGVREAEIARWRQHLAQFPCVKGLLSLDAFTRCWVQEGVLFERVHALLPEDRKDTCAALLRAWRDAQLGVFRESMEILARTLAATAADRETIVEGGWGNDAGQVRRKLATRLEDRTKTAQDQWIRLHGLEGRAAVEFRAELNDYRGAKLLVDPKRAGTIGGIASGLLGGLAADVMAGGLTLGGGMLAGALLGGFGSFKAARMFQKARGGEPELSWSDPLLTRTVEELVLRYLAVSHHGRGRGRWKDREHPDYWRTAVRKALEDRATWFNATWKEARGAASVAEVDERLQPLVTGVVREVLTDFHPEADRLL